MSSNHEIWITSFISIFLISQNLKKKTVSVSMY